MMTTSKRLALVFLFALILYGLFAAALIVRELRFRDAFHSAATATRDVYGFQSGDLGLLRASTRKTEVVRPAAEVMAEPGYLEAEAGKSFVLDWSQDPELRPATKNDRWSPTLEGDDRIELVAFATRVPEADDPLTNEGNWQADLTFRDPATLGIIPPEKLREWGIPESFARLSPPRRYETPVLRLLFRTAGMPYPHCVGMNAGDQRTGAGVSYDLNDSNDGAPRSEVSREWLRVDTELLIWHDSPLECLVRVLTGEPQMATLEQKRGAQVSFGEDLRLQWLAPMESEPSLKSITDLFTPAAPFTESHRELMTQLRADNFRKRQRVQEVAFRSPETPAPATLVRASSPHYLEEHCGLLTDGGVIRNWNSHKKEKDLYLASIAANVPPAEPLRFVFLPKVTELSFSLAGLPDMPNPRTTENLFEVTLPRITLPEDISDAEIHLLGFIGVGAQVAWESNRRWDEAIRAKLPPDRTFRNETPQSLLNWYLDHTPGAHVRYEEAGLILHFNEEKPGWRDHFDKLIQRLRLVFF